MRIVTGNTRKIGDDIVKVLIIGGVAAGTKVAAKLKREDRSVKSPS